MSGTNSYDFLTLLNLDYVEFLNFEERPFKAKLNPAKLWVKLDECRYDKRKLVNLLKPYKTRVATTQKNTFGHAVAVGGYFYYDPNFIEVILVESGGAVFGKTKFKDKRWEGIKFRIIQTLVHELIHFRQHMHRDKDKDTKHHKFPEHHSNTVNELREYYSSYDEIQTQAHDILWEMFSLNITDVSGTLARLRAKRPKPLKNIEKAFDYNYDAPQMRHLVREILRWERKYGEYIDAKKSGRGIPH